MALARDGFRPALEAVERGIVGPALCGNACATLEWYYKTRYKTTESPYTLTLLRPTHTVWRNQFESPEALQRLAHAAALSPQP